MTDHTNLIARLVQDCRAAAKVLRDAGEFETGQDILREAADALEAAEAEKAAAVSLSDVATCDLHNELIKRAGVTAVLLGPDDEITKTVRGPAWVIVNRD